MGKSIASGMPLSAIVARAEIIESLDSPAHLFTMSGHPVSCEASLATIQVIEEESLLKNSEDMGDYIKSQFIRLSKKFDMIGQVRGKGLSIGVEIVKNRETKEKDLIATAKISYRCWEKGLILINLAGNVLRVQPPLVINKEEIDQGMAIIEESIDDYLDGKISDDALDHVEGWFNKE